jgi:heme exporter protein A
VSALSARDLTARYPGQPTRAAALAGVDLSLEPGERLLLLGPNGAGKSTFIRVFAGLMQPRRGHAQIMDLPARQARGLVGVVSHATYLYDELSAFENLRFYAELYGVEQPVERARELLGVIGFAHLAHVRVGGLSRGQQQRVTIARALLHDPPVLLFDEPDTGLDVAAFGLLEELVAQPGRTVVLTTHNLGTGLRLATRVAILSAGRLVHTDAHAAPAGAAALASLLEQLARQ